MAEKVELSGEYAEDVAVLQKFIDDFTENIRTENLNIEDIIHAFVGITEEAITHGLERVPETFLIVDIDEHATIKRGTTPFTDTQIFLLSDTAGITATIRVE